MSLLKFDELDIKIDINFEYRAHRRCIKDKLVDDEKRCLEYENESLKDHIDLVYDYFLELVKQNGLETHLDKLFEQSVELILEEDGNLSNRDEFANFVKSLFAKAIYWHDMGKMNPNFQADSSKMDNAKFQQITLSEGSNHSPLGAYLFINHSLEELNIEWDEDEIEIIESIIYLFGYFISKHHGTLYKNDELEFGNDLGQFLELFTITTDNIETHKNKNRVFSSIYDYIETNKDILFLLSKSLFSLLIISDYYATAQFMNYGNIEELKYNNFGFIDKEFRNKIYQTFYQKQHLQDIEFKKEADFKSFEVLEQEPPSRENLNELRNKLFVEVRTNLKKSLEKDKNQNLFYIEAPTGAGKTNLSMMSAVEILKRDDTINKIFYVFPFTTLITQTYESIKTTLNLDNSEIVQLHSKAKYNQKNESAKDGVYGDKKTNFLDNQFMNYPITLLSHVKFFDILTGVSKDDNYIFHRLANSVVIIDEIQTYNPKDWSSIVYILDSFAKHFNIKFIVMSATLPKIGDIIDSEFEFLVSNKHKYFQNPNFAGRVTIDESTIKKPLKIKEPQLIYSRLEKESKAYQKLDSNESNKVKTIIEFITKKGADEFYQEAKAKNSGKKKLFDDIFILSGTILEPRRKEIINFIKNTYDKNILLVTTQVVEAGVDIDMDIGFKERSLLDSDEQLAGRINRNSSKEGNKLFLFEMQNPKAKFVYRGDKRLEVCVDEDVLKSKDFDKYYNQVIDKIKGQNDTPFIENLNSYIDHIKNLRFSEAHIKLIDMESVSVYVPWCDEAIAVWQKYEEAIQNKEQDLIDKKISLKELASKISQYTFSLAKYQGSGIEYLLPYGSEKYGYLYLEDYQSIYSYEDGLDTNVLKGKNVGIFI